MIYEGRDYSGNPGAFVLGASLVQTDCFHHLGFYGSFHVDFRVSFTRATRGEMWRLRFFKNTLLRCKWILFQKLNNW